MFRNDFKVMVTKALGATGLLLATACAGETGVEQGAQGLVAPGDVNRAYVQTAPMLDAAVGMDAGTAVPQDRLGGSVVAELPGAVTGNARTREPTAIDGCGSEVCGAGETCCPLTGECFPATCTDCCRPPELAAGVPPEPELTPEGPGPAN
ncbi:MAG: hypothetical protein CMN30_11305 [Sandaracinus sp.]|nr:hypothetical protein [Sandaracinus sp.]